MSRTAVLALLIGALLSLTLTSSPAYAQFMGHNFKGDFGLSSGTQAAPGFYLVPMYIRYDADRLLNEEGDSITIDPEGRGSVTANAYVIGFWHVTKFKLFGANYGFMAFPGFTDNNLEIPILDFSVDGKTAFTDLYFQPINLGWNLPRADFSTGLGITAPLGKYDPGGDDNPGLGMWSFEPYFGTTVFFDKAKKWNIATVAFYEMHTKKRGTEIKVGDILTLEGGLGRSFRDGLISVGAAYYAQWKITADDAGPDSSLLEELRLKKHQVYGVGPEVSIPIMTKSKLFASLNFRYFWDYGVRSSLDARTFMVTATFPIPSVSLR